MPALFRIPARCASLLAAVLVIGGCLLRFSPLPDPSQPVRIGHSAFLPIVDGRARFREIVCMLVDQHHFSEERCERLIWRLDDEPEPAAPAAPLPLPLPALRIMIVPGAFAECFPEYGLPFEKAAGDLRRQALSVDFIAVSGRSGADHNAAQIAAAIDRLSADPGEKIVLIGPSKGAVDILHFLVNHSRLAVRVRAVVSDSGPIEGSPLANALAGVYRSVFSRMPFADCPPGDRKVIDSLRRSERTSWLASHRLPEHVRYFSLASFARREEVHPLMLFTYDALAAAGERNNGYVAVTEQLIPGSTLLGWVNLDHWDIALPVRERLNFSGVGSRADARRLLFEAMLLAVLETLQFSP